MFPTSERPPMGRRCAFVPALRRSCRLAGVVRGFWCLGFGGLGWVLTRLKGIKQGVYAFCWTF